jgi:hypothetical protein
VIRSEHYIEIKASEEYAKTLEQLIPEEMYFRIASKVAFEEGK